MQMHINAHLNVKHLMVYSTADVTFSMHLHLDVCPKHLNVYPKHLNVYNKHLNVYPKHLNVTLS